MNGCVLVIDFEFTMPDHDRYRRSFVPEIIEVGLVQAVDGEVKATFTSFVKPVINPTLTERCQAFLGITQQDVNKGITFPELVRKRFYAPGQTIVTWGNMDLMVLKRSCLEWNLPYPFSQAEELDLAMGYKRFFGDRNQTGLWRALSEYGKAGEGKRHRALDDARSTWEVYRLMEQDKRYLNKPEPVTIGDLINLFGVI